MIDCWHTLAIVAAARFVEDCKAQAFDEATEALQRLLCGDDPPSAPLCDLVRGVLVEVQAEHKRAQEVFPKLLDQLAKLKAKWITEHDAPAADATMIRYVGEKAYSIGRSPPVTVTDPEHAILQEFIMVPSMDTDLLQTRTGNDRAPRTLREFTRRYNGVFAPAIQLAKTKGTGGYHVSIKDARTNRA